MKHYGDICKISGYEVPTIDEFIKSPMNYTGGKYKLLPQLLVVFPEKINKFCDLFCGGLNVGINVESDEIYANDRIVYIIQLYEIFKTSSIESIIAYIESRIMEYSLSDNDQLSYNKLRDEYNRSRKLLDLFVLTCYSFNNQIRFNSMHDFNSSFGARSWNPQIKYNLTNFCKAMQSKSVHLSSLDFRLFDFSNFDENDLVYCDPPYLITTAAYNDGKRGFYGWSQQDDIDLMNLLDNLNSRHIQFALSNALEHHGIKNDRLIDWSKNYYVSYIDKDYHSCNYQVKDRTSKTTEVLITNYEPRIDIQCTLF